MGENQESFADYSHWLDKGWKRHLFKTNLRKLSTVKIANENTLEIFEGVFTQVPTHDDCSTISCEVDVPQNQQPQVYRKLIETRVPARQGDLE